MFANRYRATQQVRFEHMGDIRWHYVEAPPALKGQMAGCPTSEHEHGVIATETELNINQRNKAGLEPL